MTYWLPKQPPPTTWRSRAISAVFIFFGSFVFFLFFLFTFFALAPLLFLLFFNLGEFAFALLGFMLPILFLLFAF
ncbi:hypothetical protein D3C83_129260 [compost metagenome]